MKNLIAFALMLMLFACDQTSLEKKTLTSTDLNQILSTSSNFKSYVSSSASEMIQLSRITEQQYKTLKAMLNSYQTNQGVTISDLSNYQKSLGLSTSESSVYHANVLSELSKYNYKIDDLNTIIQTSIKTEITTAGKKDARLPLEAVCGTVCWSKASAIYDSQIAGSTTPETKQTASIAKQAWFAGCTSCCLTACWN